MDFLLFVYFIYFDLIYFPFPPLICHLPEDLHPSIEYTQRSTQRNKSITHSITGTAWPAGSGFGEKQDGRSCGYWRLLVCQRFWQNASVCLSAALLSQAGTSSMYLDWRLISVIRYFTLCYNMQA